MDTAKQRIGAQTWVAFLLAICLLLGGIVSLFLLNRYYTNNPGNGYSSLAAQPVSSSYGRLANSTSQSGASSQDLKTIIQTSQKDVVQLQVKTSDGEDLGSGFLYDQKGDVITNAHVVGDATTVDVKMADSTVYTGTVIGKSDTIDIALVRVNSLTGKQPLKVATSTKGELGDDVIAFGSPLGLDNTVTTGIISGLNRDLTIENYNYKNLYQISAPIAPGNSGGPLLLEKTGEVIGVNSAGANQGNIGFSIPISQVLSLVSNWADKPSPPNPSSDTASAVQNPLETNNAAQGGTDDTSSTTVTTQAAESLVQSFYDSLNSQDYVTAYSLLGSDWQQQTPFETFRNGYLNTLSVQITQIQSTQTSDDTVTVTAIITAQERSGQGDSTDNQYQVTYKVASENNQLRLLSGQAQKL